MSQQRGSSPDPADVPETNGPGRASRVPIAVLRWALTVVVLMTLAGGLLLVSSPSPPKHLRRAVAKGEASPGLLGLVNVLCLNYAHPTLEAMEVKSLVFRLGLAGLAFITASILLLAHVQTRQREPSVLSTDQVEVPPSGHWLRRVPPVECAQGLLLLVVVWSAISRVWSNAPDLSLRATAIVAIQAAWALLLARGMALLGRTARTLRIVTGGLVVTACLATLLTLRINGLSLWPTELFFPVGQAHVFAACMVPAALLALGWLGGPAEVVLQGSSGAGMNRWITHVVCLSGLVAVLAVLVWGIALSGSRAAWVGLGAGVIVLGGLFWGRRGRTAVAIIGALALVLAGIWMYRFAQTSGSLGAADVRLCGYGWRAALRIWTASHGTGMGQAAFEMTGQRRVLDELVQDPAALGDRWRGHAMNEWLEVLADLGLVGFLLVAGVLTMTLKAGALALQRLDSAPTRRVLIGLMAAMVGIAVEECMGSALRQEPLPALWYTTLAGIWAIALSCESSSWVWALARPVRVGGAFGAALLGVAVGWAGLRDFHGEEALRLASWRLPTRRVGEAVHMTEVATEGLLRPGHLCLAGMIDAEAHFRLGAEGLADLVVKAGRTLAASQPIRGLWADWSFRSGWDEARRHLDLALRSVARVQGRFTTFPGAWALEAQTCQALARMARLQAELEGDPNAPDVRTALAEVQRYHRRRIAALKTELAHRPFDHGQTVELVRAEGNLPLSEVVDLIRRPLRGQLLPDTYQSIILQIGSSEGFPEAIAPFLAAANRAAKAPRSAPTPDPFAPETLRMAAMVLGADRKLDQAVATVRACIGLYAVNHARLSVQQAMAMDDLAWYQLLAGPDQAKVALATLQRAVDVSDRPALHWVLHPIYRRMVQVFLMAGDETAARELASSLPWSQEDEPDPDALLAFSYEVLGTTFHRSAPDRRPAAWRRWVERGAELNPRSPGIQLLVAAMACEQKDDTRAAACIEKAWQQDSSLENRQECVRTLAYALRWNPESRPLQLLHQRLVREVRAATEPTTTRATLRGERSPASQPGPPSG